MKLAVAQNIRDFCAGGGFLFAMCSGTDTFDIALAASNTDIAKACLMATRRPGCAIET
jgi:hypothetical protein